MRQNNGLSFLLLAGLMTVVTMVGCRDEANTGPEVTGIRFARRTIPAPEAEVTATDPTNAPQDTTLDVEVMGSGFDRGSAVQLTLSGVPTEKVRTNSTQYRNAKTLIANITIAVDADVDFYDVEVTTASRKKGIGTEMFEVTATQILTFSFRDGSDLLAGDGRVIDASARTTYTTDECGVRAVMPGYNGNAYLRTKANPIQQDEAQACGGGEGRVFRVSFTKRVDTGDPLDWDGQTMNAKWLDVFYEIRTIPLGVPEVRKLRITFDDKGTHPGNGNGWGQACPWGLEFNGEWTGSSDVRVTRLRDREIDGYDAWQVEATAPNDVAVCLDGKSEPAPVALYEVPFQMTVECHGNC